MHIPQGIGPLFQDVLRQVNCMAKEDFKKAFPDEKAFPDKADYLWEKFVYAKECDVFDFICYLDPINAQLLVEYAIQKEMHQREVISSRLRSSP